MYPAESLTERVAVADSVIPLAEGITMSTGEHITQIPIRKGQLMTLSLASFQRSIRACVDFVLRIDPY